MKQRLRNPNFEPINTNLPGPGQYASVGCLTKNGTYYNSKFKSVNSVLYDSKAGSRFKYRDKEIQETPGPGEYSPKTELSNSGHYFLSNFKSSRVRSLYKSKRKTLKSGHTNRYYPGPGDYVLPSDFGYPDDLANKIKSKRRSSSVIKGSGY
jgi:hypothetical protein